MIIIIIKTVQFDSTGTAKQVYSYTMGRTPLLKLDGDYFLGLSLGFLRWAALVFREKKTISLGWQPWLYLVLVLFFISCKGQIMVYYIKLAHRNASYPKFLIILSTHNHLFQFLVLVSL